MQIGFFDVNKRYSQLDKLNDPLLTLSELIDFEIFRVNLEKSLEKDRKNNSGRKPFDKIMLFKCLILKRLYDLSDEALEFQITDRSSFRRFLGLEENDLSPDRNTFWNFSNELAKKGTLEELFIKFNDRINQQGYTAKDGSMVDASFIEVPKQRNNRDENKEIKEGKIPENFLENEHKFAQKDTDARWTKKGDTRHFGYKNHINVDVKSKIIRSFLITSAEIHDSKPFCELMDYSNDTSKIWADSAYLSKEIIKFLESKGIEPRINERGYRNKPLGDEQKAKNRVKSRTRARVEHVFGFAKNSLKARSIRTIGIIRAKSQIAMINLTYNICRFCQLERMKAVNLA